MKTAKEQIHDNLYCYLDESDDTVCVQDAVDTIIVLMESYAKQVAESTLMAVCERLSKLKESEGGMSLNEFHEIVNTPIQLP